MSKEIKEKSFNTNNDWGFGGTMGTEYTYGDWQLLIGKFCYRHAPSTKYRQLRYKKRNFHGSKVRPMDLPNINEIVVVLMNTTDGHKNNRFMYFEGHTEKQAIIKTKRECPYVINYIKAKTIKL